MQKWIVILTGVLVVQLVVALGLNLTGEDYAVFEPQEKLLVFDKEAVDKLRIADSENSIMLTQQDGKWVLPENGDFPADQEAVNQLLNKLAGLEKGFPVATTASAAKRFKVADEAFERQLTLLANDESQAVLYIGTSPGFRRVHVRPEGEEAVYAVAFNTWEANAETDDWIDKDILQLDKSKVERIEMPDFRLQRDGEALRLANLADQEEIDAEKVNSLLDNLAGLRIQSLLDTEARSAYRQDQPEVEFKVTLNDDEVLTYRIYKSEDTSDYAIKRSDFDYYFKVDEFTIKLILDTQREKLMKARAEDEPSELGSP